MLKLGKKYRKIYRNFLVSLLFIGISTAKSSGQTFRLQDSIRFRLPVTVYPVKSNYYCNNLGFFCRQELKMDKLTVMPIRFRLGSMNYVNYLEQKPNARARPF